MALKAGTVNDYDDSMASAIEQAFSREWFHAMHTTAPANISNAQMKLLFVAIAQGVVNYLKDHDDSFKLRGTGAIGFDPSALSIEIETE